MRTECVEYTGDRIFGILIEIKLPRVVVLGDKDGVAKVIRDSRPCRAVGRALSRGALAGVRARKRKRQHKRQARQPVSLLKLHQEPSRVDCHRAPTASGRYFVARYIGHSTGWAVGKQRLLLIDLWSLSEAGGSYRHARYLVGRRL